jgi:glycosyltransferase involved in cell wall biosynthesis
MNNIDRQKLTMIVPVFNGMRFIDAFIRPFNKNEYSWDIIFVDNASDDGSFEYLKNICKQNPSWQVFSFIDKKSSYAARNYGASLASGSIFLFTDIDCILTERYFKFINSRKFEKDTLLSGPTNIFLDTHNLYEYFDQCAYLNQENYSKKHYAATANLIVSKTLYERAGGFPEFVSGADNKFCQNCYSLGVQICFQSELVVKHPPRASLVEHIAKAKRLGIGHGEFILDMSLGFVRNVLMIIKQLVLIVIPVHSFRLFFRVCIRKKLSFNEVIALIKLCYLAGYHQRLNIILTIATMRRS